MEFSTQTSASLHQLKTPALAVGVFIDKQLSDAADIIDRAGNGAIRQAIGAEFSGKPGSTLVLRAVPGVSAERIVLVGLGKQADYSAKTHATAEQAFAAYCHGARLSQGVSALAGVPCQGSGIQERARAAAIAAVNAVYQFTETVSKPAESPAKLTKLVLWVSRADNAQAQKGLREGRAIGNGQALARLLGDLPPNVCTPTYLGETARQLAKEFKTLKAQVLQRKDIEALEMGSFLSVARGSEQPPVFIVLKYTPAQAKGAKKKGTVAPVVLIGKGITFDAGGISLKPAANMDEMKYDMCGAAGVLGTMRAVAELELDREVIALVPSCENLPSGTANKPGDVVTSMSGKTIEILNTDAEGRLILCDALTYAERFKPAAVIDVATLTGACVVALGHVNTGLFSKNDALAESLLQAGKNIFDTVWRMPLDDAYQDQLKSNFADMANIGGMPAGSVTAACFLSRFAESYPWAHLDIAGTAWRSGKDKGATGRPVPLLVNYLLNHAG